MSYINKISKSKIQGQYSCTAPHEVTEIVKYTDRENTNQKAILGMVNKKLVTRLGVDLAIQKKNSLYHVKSSLWNTIKIDKIGFVQETYSREKLSETRRKSMAKLLNSSR